jgi:hypothetical protein
MDTGRVVGVAGSGGEVRRRTGAPRVGWVVPGWGEPEAHAMRRRLEVPTDVASGRVAGRKWPVGTPGWAELVSGGVGAVRRCGIRRVAGWRR